ncbi:FxsA family protein [uncultured Tateyamaria sp.]|uniref:FxsA family protein n=1 Tax=uncultured Tateyamaria sp. TaxID=455651 RepID=UPI0026083E4A|nr:FxsA family protein [uncultured Tateyamaria sp.]
MWLFIAFLTVPLIEIGLFIQIGGAIGLWWTLLIVIITAVIGTVLVRAQGVQALGQVKSSFNEMRDPSEALAHGAMILFSGALLLTPGFFTDAVGFALLVPGVRLAVFKWARARINVTTFSTHPQHPPQSDVIEGEYAEVEPESGDQGRPSGWTKH